MGYPRHALVSSRLNFADKPLAVGSRNDTLDGNLEGETHKIGPGTHRRCAWVQDGACIGGYSLVAVLIDVSRGVL